MKVVLYGATGMIGSGVLTECLEEPAVSRVLSVGRRPSGVQHAKLDELIVRDLHDYSAVEARLSGYDACFYCLGVSSVGMNEQDYTRVTHDLALAAATALRRHNPGMVFCFVSGQGTDPQSGTMWARVKGRTEDALDALGFRAVYHFRPGYIQPMKGARSRTTLYRVLYAIAAPLYPLLRAAAGNSVTTTVNVGQAMIQAAEHGASKTRLENRDINELALRRTGG